MPNGSMIVPLSLVLLLQLLALQDTVAFLANPRPTHNARPATATTHNVVFTKLSEDCLGALGIAQEQASISGLKEIDETYMLLGLCQFPGKCESVFEKYKIKWENVRRTLNYLNDSGSKNKPLTLADFKENDADVMLPYGKGLQERLFEAGKISQTMGAPQIETEHVFLSLLHYQEIDGVTYAATRGDDCKAMEILEHEDATVDGEDVTQDLLQHLMEERTKSSTDAEKSTSTTPSAPQTASPSTQNAMQGGGGGTGKPDRSEIRSMIAEFGSDLTAQAANGDLDVVQGRDEEIESALRILLRRRKNNCVLIGEAGVGKTAIAEGLAQILASDECPALLKGYKMISLEVSSLLSGTQFRGAFEERFRGILDEITDGSQSRTILFLDEMHTLMGSGSTEGSGIDAANLLKPYLARGQLKVVGATTITEYNRMITKDAALDRRFQPVLIREPTVEQTVEILKALVPFYQSHHRVEFEPQSLEAAAKLSDRYIADRFLPDKAIDLLDEAGAVATLRRVPDQAAPVVDENLVTEIVSDWSSIPVGTLQMEEKERLEALEETMAERIKGQERAVKAVAKAIRRARTGIRDHRRPISSLLFCGPTGTGKTELCKTLAETYYGSEKNLIRIDMSEYMEKQQVTRLIGPPPGLIGYEEGGVLTEAVRRSPHSVILLDELEKAHPDVLNLLLQVIDDGILTDGKGRTVSFKNTIIIMTSNIGSKRILDLVKESKGVTMTGRPPYSQLASVVKSELESNMKPEFLNRIDDIVIFEPLTDNELFMIASMMSLGIVLRSKRERDIDVTVEGPLLEKMVNEGSKAASQFGARPMRRAVQRILEDSLSDAVMKNFLQAGDKATFDLEKEQNLECDLDDMRRYNVIVTRERDGETFAVEIEESCRDMAAEAIEDIGTKDEDDASQRPNGVQLQVQHQKQEQQT